MKKKDKSMFSEKQRLFIEAFASVCACNVSATCRKIGISRRIYYTWMNSNEDFRNAIDDEQEALLDMAETKLHQNIMEGREASIFFFLKTKGKNRGYIETIDNRFSVDPFMEAMKSLPDIPQTENE